MRKKREKKSSIRLKIAMLMIAHMVAIVVLLCLFNTFFFEEYYFKNKQDELVSTFKKMNKIIAEYDEGGIGKVEFEGRIERLCEPRNISAIILRSDWMAVYATKNDTEILKKRMQDNLFGKADDEMIIKENDSYRLQRIYDKDMADEYLEIFGYVQSDDILFMRIPVKSITDSARISNKFIVQVGIVFVIIAFASSYYIAIRISGPIKKISNLAKNMSDIKFDDRYVGDDNDEIGVLGKSLNTLADRLDETISELKTANNNLKNDIESKEKQEEARIDFIANVSHELKTPIALIQGYAEGLKEEIYDSKENAEYYCNVIIDEAQKMNSLVRSLLSLNQIESGGDTIVIEKFNVTELIKSIVESYRLKFSQNGIKVNMEIDEPVTVWADEFKIETVVSNYISNAINHCSGEKIVTIYAIKNADTVRILIRNTGNKIPENDISRVWEKFYKVDKARTREYGGNGIGLSIVKAIMENHNKQYGVNNTEDGVEFWFELDTKYEM